MIKIWLGGARSAQTTQLYEYVTAEAIANPDRNYLVIVPEQSNLNTLAKFIEMNPRKGILNIDVLSFMRLAHRILDEVGFEEGENFILSDMDKNLILMELAAAHEKELTVFADQIERLGYITEIKSLVSEFMQYRISPDRVDEISQAAASGGKNLLAGKLDDVNVLYRAFLEYCKGKCTTGEELLDKVSTLAHMWKPLENSVVVLNGYTGFTPVQYKLIATLSRYACEVHVALCKESRDESEPGGSDFNRQSLFAMTDDTLHRLERICDEEKMPQPEIVNITEKSVQYACGTTEFSIINAADIFEETELTASVIKKLIVEEGYRYSDIAVVVGDLNGYRNALERTLGNHGIPYFVDKTQPVLMNPFTEYVRALMQISADNYSYEAVFRLLKTSLSDIPREDVYRLENYVLAKGIKGRGQWHTRWTGHTREVGAQEVLAIDRIRERFVNEMDRFERDILHTDADEYSFRADKKARVRDMAEALYNITVRAGIEGRLKAMADEFDKANKPELKAEYSRIYGEIIELLDRMVALMGEERMDIRRFAQLIDAGMDEIRIGIVPPGTDYVTIGDLKRTRLENVKTLFIMGVNDGIIPGNCTSTGIVNDSERDYLKHNVDGLEMAPTATEKLYTERFYLYMVMSKPSDRLYLSYSNSSIEGKALRPSYLIRAMKARVPDASDITVGTTIYDRIFDAASAGRELAIGLSGIEGADEAELHRIMCLFKYCAADEVNRPGLMKLLADALIVDTLSGTKSIGAAIADVIYGKNIKGSVTRLETYASCAYKYFLQYGLRLKDRELLTFDAMDLGNIYHATLEAYGKALKERAVSFTSLTKAARDELVDECVDKVIAAEHMAKLYGTVRNEIKITRIKRIMERTIDVVTNQVRAGSFNPSNFEVSFDSASNPDVLALRLADSSEMQLTGKIDRIDTCTLQDDVFVRIIDYKSGNKSFDLAAVYEGRQLQLVVYLGVALDMMKATGKNVRPAGILYYRIADPLIKDGQELDVEKLAQTIEKELKMTGMVNRDPDVIELMDTDFTGYSRVIPVQKTKEGIKENNTLNEEDFAVMEEYVKKVMCELGDGIKSGNIESAEEQSPSGYGGEACEYCDFQSICMNRNMSQSEEDGEDAHERNYEPDIDPKDYDAWIDMMRARLV